MGADEETGEFKQTAQGLFKCGRFNWGGWLTWKVCVRVENADRSHERDLCSQLNSEQQFAVAQSYL